MAAMIFRWSMHRNEPGGVAVREANQCQIAMTSHRFSRPCKSSSG